MSFSNGPRVQRISLLNTAAGGDAESLASSATFEGLTPEILWGLVDHWLTAYDCFAAKKDALETTATNA